MEERKGVITFKGNPLTLIGPELKVGQKAPDAEVLGNDLSPVKISDLQGKVRILSVVPSLDTPVCQKQTHRFNDEVAGLGDDVVILTVSMDLPFAQKRWVDEVGVDQITTLSDHRSADFGLKYGLLIKELRLLARSVAVLDREGTVRYIQIVPEVTEEPDYDPALQAAKKLV